MLAPLTPRSAATITAGKLAPLNSEELATITVGKQYRGSPPTHHDTDNLTWGDFYQKTNSPANPVWRIFPYQVENPTY